MGVIHNIGTLSKGWGLASVLLMGPLVFAATLMIAASPALANKHDLGEKGDRGHQEERHHEGSAKFENHHGPTGQAQGWGPRMGAALEKLNKEQQEAFRKSRTAMRRKLNTLGAELRNLRLDLKEEMRKIPLSISSALAVWEQIQAKSKEIFQARLENLREMQQLLGEELWAEVSAGVGMGGPRKKKDRGKGHGKGPPR